MNWTIAIIGIIIAFYLLRRMHKSNQTTSYDAELQSILYNDDNKAKGRFE